MNRLSSRNQLIIGAVLIVVVTVAVVVLGILPLFQKASDLDAQITDADTQLQTANALVERRQSTKARSAENEVELMRIANQLPESPELPSVIIDLQNTANATGLDFIQITPGDLTPSEDGSYQSVPLTIVLHGDWADIIEYCRKVDKLTRGVRASAGSFARVEESDDTGDIDAYIETQMTLEVYVMGEAPADATVPTAQ